MPRGVPKVVNYEEKIGDLKSRIEKKQLELKNLRVQLSEAEAEYKNKKNEELNNFLASEGIDATRASELIRRALEMEKQQNGQQAENQQGEQQYQHTDFATLTKSKSRYIPNRVGVYLLFLFLIERRIAFFRLGTT